MAELHWKNLFLVFAGGGAGSVLRFVITKLSLQWFAAYPAGTLAANLLGALIAGIAAVLIFEKHLIVPPWNDLVLAGFLGGLTTFSTMILDAYRLAQHGLALAAVIYIFVNVVLGASLFAFAQWIARAA
ncbi:MAG: fluoride efflux transporter CrcB [Turneriella sp.]